MCGNNKKVRTNEYCRKAEFEHQDHVCVTFCVGALVVRKDQVFPTVVPNESVLDIAVSKVYKITLCPPVQSLFTNVFVLT